ncbi:MAG TPA: hypothetical protein VMU39_13880 [Solirubrobacteraceae bacterium]|nr:hypothetical protein [Solirubrobacteraceae bacterium]
MSAAARLRGVLPAMLVVIVLALVGPALDHASASPNQGAGGKVTCGGGSEPGDVQTVHTYTYIGGKLVSKSSTSFICGNDGRWHMVAELTVSPGHTFPVLSGTTLRIVG